MSRASPRKGETTMPVSKANQRAVNKYKKNNYDRMEIVVPKGTRETIKVHAEARYESVNGFIKRAISETMERDSSGIPLEAAEKGLESTQGAGVVYLYPSRPSMPLRGQQKPQKKIYRNLYRGRWRHRRSEMK